MTERYHEDLIRLTLEHMSVDERFTIRGPHRHPTDRDAIHVYVDCVRNPPPHATSIVEFRKSKMRGLSERQLVKCVEMKVRFAEEGLLDFIEEEAV